MSIPILNALKRSPLTLCATILLACAAASCATQHETARAAAPDPGPLAPKPAAPAYPLQNLVQYVNPLCGTAADGDLYPGASAPFGMIQWSPDTGSGRHDGGYAYEVPRICGFTLDHLSGAGCDYGENFSIMPILGTVTASPFNRHTAFVTAYSHSQETARPGCYGLTFDNGIKVELTATERTGFGRFTFPTNDTPTITINAASGVNGVKQSAVQINPAQREISGWAVGGHFCGGPDEGRTYFCATFDQSFATYGTWNADTLTNGNTDSEGRFTGAFVNFNLSGDRTVLARVALSYVSVASARANLEAECPLSAFSPDGFDKAAAAASDTWNGYLNRIQVSGGTDADLRTFYSMLYRVLLGPTICSDANGSYMGYDGQVHTATNWVQYANFSGWDIYRSESQLLALLDPPRAGDMAQSLLMDYQQGGAFPRWGVPNEDSGVMMGDPAAPIITDFYAFGATNFDVRATLAGLIRAAIDPSVSAPRTGTYERDALADYLNLGFVPEHQQGGYGNVSMTLEYDSADFALSQFAAALGDTNNSAILLRHAQNWKNLYNPDTGYLQMRRRDGTWAPDFKTYIEGYDGNQAYVEGTAAQYLWMHYPFNLKGLAEKMGGPDTAAKRLDTFFTRLNAGTESNYAYLGNEPCLETPWEYCFWGQPYKTQQVVRQAMTQLFSSGPRGYPGNDDLGEMSSWYVFSALGMYPELPGSDVLVLGSPLFEKAVLHLPSGDITILGNNAADNAPYVQSLTLNGQPWNKPWLHFTDIAHGGNLAFTLGAAPVTTWGSNPADAPPGTPSIRISDNSGARPSWPQQVEKRKDILKADSYVAQAGSLLCRRLAVGWP